LANASRRNSEITMKAKFKGVELVRSLDEGRRLLRALHIYVFENE